MDVATVTAAQLTDRAQAERWFECISAEYESLTDPDWDAFRDGFAARAQAESFPATNVEAFVAHVEATATSPLEAIAELADRGRHAEALQLFEQATAQRFVGDWESYLDWWHNGWDGAEDTWPGFAERFRAYAPLEHLALADHVLAYALSQPDKASALVHYGITSPVVEEPATHEPSAPSEPSGEAALSDKELAVAALSDEELDGLLDAIHTQVMAELTGKLPSLAEELGVPEDELLMLIEDNLSDVVFQELLAG
jgi:hypothetical protein